jgi:pyruvate dehydrogenase E1 component alpha subunit
MRVDWLAEMLLLRRFEEEAQRQYQASKVGGFLHLGIGEEATTVGAVAALRKQDYLIGAYRTHGYALARGTEPRAVMAELFGRSTGCSGGRGGSMHTFDGERRYLGGYGIVGGQVPIAGGLALAIHLGGKDEVVMCQLGDGATDEGVFAETLNMSSLWDCPILFLVSNNHYSMGTALHRHAAHPLGEAPRLNERGRAYGIEGRLCDGMDVQDVYNTCQQALEDVREQQRPIIVEAMTYRFRGHSVADPQRYRSKDEVTEQQERDPITALSQELIAEGRASEEGIAALDDAATRVVADAVRFAEDSPFPDNDTLYDHVYSESDATQGAIEMRAWDPVDDKPQGELYE